MGLEAVELGGPENERGVDLEDGPLIGLRNLNEAHIHPRDTIFRVPEQLAEPTVRCDGAPRPRDTEAAPLGFSLREEEGERRALLVRALESYGRGVGAAVFASVRRTDLPRRSNLERKPLYPAQSPHHPVFSLEDVLECLEQVLRCPPDYARKRC